MRCHINKWKKLILSFTHTYTHTVSFSADSLQRQIWSGSVSSGETESGKESGCWWSSLGCDWLSGCESACFHAQGCDSDWVNGNGSCSCCGNDSCCDCGEKRNKLDFVSANFSAKSSAIVCYILPLAILVQLELAPIQICSIQLLDGILHITVWSKLHHPVKQIRTHSVTSMWRSEQSCVYVQDLTLHSYWSCVHPQRSLLPPSSSSPSDPAGKQKALNDSFLRNSKALSHTAV